MTRQNPSTTDSTASPRTPRRASAKTPWHVVRQSALHGNGVFAAKPIPAGTRIIQYGGRRITSDQADAIFPTNPDDPFHTFFFSLSSGMIIDGGNRGNDARWINHACSPNCEAQENSDGTRVTIVALRDIPAGQELFYDYGLIIDGRVSKTLRKQYLCLCGSPECRGTMLALPKKKAKKAKKGEGKTADAKSNKRQGGVKEKKSPAGKDSTKRKTAKRAR